MRAFLPIRLLTASLVVALAGVTVPAAAADTPVATSSSDATEAQQALAQAKALFAGSTTVRERRTAQDTGTGPDATLVLRELALRVDDLPTPAQRATAQRILARPTTTYDPTGGLEPKYQSPDGSACGVNVCVHWVEDGTADSVQGTGVGGNDGDLTTIPTQVSLTLRTMETVYTKEVTDLGYDAPLSDGTRGGDGRTDVYLADLGNDGLYGYCASDQPDQASTRQVYGYCVLDNDYRAGQYGSYNTPQQNLEVTAAHEYFHAVQFAYDWQEDAWLMEGTAAWMEDEVYDSVNDNRQYLAQSPLGYPYVPLDYSDSGYLPYGAWIFWRFLSEWTGPGAADNPGIIRKVWEAARGARYSTPALQKVLVARGSSFATAFSVFGTWTRNPSQYFSEGAAYDAAMLTDTFRLSKAHRTTGRHRAPVSHMTHRFYRITPGTTLTGRWRLRVAVNMANISRGSVARLVIHRKSGALKVLGVHLNRTGNGSRRFDFRRSTVKYLELELLNTSRRFDCNQGSYQTCQGYSLDDGLRAVFNATAVRY